MNIAWKEMKKNKVRFLILASIIILVSLLTFIISGLANGLSQDNAALIKDLPNGQFFMNANADDTHNLSRIDNSTQEEMLNEQKDAVAFSIQLGFLNDRNEKQRSVAFVTSTDSNLFENVKDGEIILDRSMEDAGIKVGDILTNNQFSGQFIVRGFVDQKKYSHSPVAYINIENYKEIYRDDEMQLLFIPGGKKTQVFPELQSYTKKEFLQTIPSYSAEQLSLNMIVWFLVVISGMLFAIFFYMMNVQKIALFGILKAIGVKTSALFKMMWTQMLLITTFALVLSVALSQIFNILAPKGMPFSLTLETTIELSIVFVIIGFIGSTLSGVQIKKVEPLQAIQQGEI
ncbi:MULTISPECIES: ABC transporter permease [unclassified Bacillus (in: firmicutes)]|uniref:ABC transporter permease n=1 Tax=unclassified Bacillus (in: firmicutes) TaxID=185979 RepID=UPI0008EF1B8C|nr:MULTISPECIES: ABC transporter permease [unclassified Bacillus (in: firmicutes)]SFA87245.1 putative ABC transport system permease protein [Bacillus sp. UNCCL13]SFQ84139.1 putative ABC transport system permease protein [Bacillus sp. cl95]